MTVRNVLAHLLKDRPPVVTFALALRIDLLSAMHNKDLVTLDDPTGTMTWETACCMPRQESGYGNQYR
jgi:hypothetical protein